MTACSGRLLSTECFHRLISPDLFRPPDSALPLLHQARFVALVSPLALVLPYRGFFTTRVSLQSPGPLVPQIPRVHESVWSLTRGSPPTRVGLDAALLARSSRWPCRSSRRCSGCRSRRLRRCRHRSPRRSPRRSSCSLLPLPLLQISPLLWVQVPSSVSSSVFLLALALALAADLAVALAVDLAVDLLVCLLARSCPCPCCRSRRRSGRRPRRRSLLLYSLVTTNL